MIRRLALIVPLLALLAFIGLVLSKQNGRQPPQSPLVGRAVPVFDLPGLDAAHPGLADADLHRGTVTLVNLFASWCLPCKAEAPHLKALQQRGLVVHGIAVADKPADTQAFLKTYGDPFARIGVDSDRAVARAFRAGGYPESFLIDGNGTVILHHVGDIRGSDVPAILATAKAERR